MKDKYYYEWEKFAKTGKCNPKIIRPLVLSSWERCRAYGVDPFMSSGECYIEDKQYLNVILQTNKFLLAVVNPYMNILDNIVKGTGYIGLLADKEGYIIYSLGDPDLLKSAQENSIISPGAIRRENLSGTTAIALCLINKQPVQLFSAEHYCKFYHEWTCAAAPICDEFGELVGVLNLSGNYRSAHKHTLGIAISLAKAMEDAFRLQATNTYLRNCIDSSEYGMVILDNKYKVRHLNKILEQYCSHVKGEALGKHINEVLFSKPPVENLLTKDNNFFEKSISIKNKGKHNTLLINVQSVFDDANKAVGKLVMTKEQKYVHHLINRMVGAYAKFTFDDILSKDEKVIHLVELAKSVASTDARVLIQGESGTGKELFAQAIHNASKLRDGPFIGINCSAIPAELIESELFGYNEGAFSGAKKGGMPGKFELADGGTIFLDEIDSMPHAMQIKLLRVLEENKIVRVGGNVVLPVTVRIIAASGKRLEDLVNQGRFRLDLYYRINTITLDLPPLRERKEDILMLAEHIIGMTCYKLGLAKKTTSEEFDIFLKQRQWPGNVRELGNVIERAIIMAQNEDILTLKHSDYNISNLPASLPKAADHKENQSIIKTLKEVEQAAIAGALEAANNNYGLAAKMLGIHRNTLYNKLKDM